jgi:signal transduction histidine kinase
MKVRNKIFIYIFLSAVLMIIGMYLIAYYWLSNFHLSEAINDEKKVARLVALESRDFILTNDLIALRNLFQSTIKSNSRVAYIFAERNDEVLAHTFEKGIPRGLLNLGEFSDQFDPDITPIENGDGFLIYHIRFKVGKPSFAMMHLGISAQALKAELIPLHRLMVIAGCFFLMVVPFSMAYFLSRVISRPISILREGSERIGRGKFDYRLSIKTGDEIEQLADEFNRMSEKLEVSYATLEQRVAERTEKLQKEISERRKALNELKRHEQMLEVSERNLRKFSRKILSVREEEKKKLSNSLHDELGSMTVALGLSLGIVEEEIRDNNVQGALDAVNQARNMFKKSVKEFKKITKDLRPPDIDIVDLPNVLRRHFSNIEEQTKIKIDFSVNMNMNEKKLSDEIAIALYRVNQEALNNIVRHAGAKKVKIRLNFQGNKIKLTINDDGKGFDMEEILQKKDGFGIRGMREWIESSGGTFIIKSAPKEGTEISATIANVKEHKL